MLKIKSNFPKISIVTPNYNQVSYLEETILSVINQNYPNLEYIIIDGGSTDGSIDIIKKYEVNLKYWISEPDNGMYDAINKGFNVSTGEIMGWINSDDMYLPNAFKTVEHLFNKYRETEWITGSSCSINENSYVLNNGLLKNTSIKKLRLYGKYPSQEATFWKRNLWDKAGAKMNLDFQYAGDFDLWLRFSAHRELYTVTSIFSAFRFREGQLSSFYNLYEKEMKYAFKINNVTKSNQDKALKIYINILKNIPGIRNLESIKNHIDKLCSVKFLFV